MNREEEKKKKKKNEQELRGKKDEMAIGKKGLVLRACTFLNNGQLARRASPSAMDPMGIRIFTTSHIYTDSLCRSRNVEMDPLDQAWLHPYMYALTFPTL